MKRVTVTIAPDGSTKVEAHGFTGKECQKATEGVVRALGGAAKEELKQEYFKRAAVQSVQGR
jgi:hypothetical protein